MKNVVAIDGPAGSGKSTVAKLVAKRLDFLHVDTGAMYRALTLRAIRSGAPLGDESRVERVIAGAVIGLDGGRVTLDGADVTDEIRSSKVTRHVATVSAYPSVRSILVAQQRAYPQGRPGIVMEGRDIGTVVFPDARWKFYLDARPEVRARRRQAELAASGRSRDLELLLAEMIERDREDSERVVAPLKCAEDALRIDTSELAIEEVVEGIAAEVEARKPLAQLW